jgi:hypothetical protein
MIQGFSGFQNARHTAVCQQRIVSLPQYFKHIYERELTFKQHSMPWWGINAHWCNGLSLMGPPGFMSMHTNNKGVNAA